MTITRAEFVRAAAVLAVAPRLRFAAAVDPRVRTLDRAVRGPVLALGTAAYERARLVYNARFNTIAPLAVVQPLDARDVQAVVRWASQTRVPIVARSGGHSYAGYSTTRGVVVDLSRIAGVQASGGRAVVGAGARLGRVYARLADHGVAIPAGSCPSVGIAGLALGGGFGLASRAWGLTCDNLVAVDVVTADGRLLSCDAKRHADLFWALRGGGGGNFGIATRFVFRTHPVRSGSYFVATFPWSAVEEVVDRFLRWAPAAPDALGPICRLAAGGASPSVQVFGQFLGEESELKSVLGGLTAGLPAPRLSTGSASWLDLVRRWADCFGSLEACTVAEPQEFAAGSDYINRVPPGIGATLRRAVEQRGTESGAILLDSYGGAVNRVRPAAAAFVHRRERSSVQYFATGEPAAARGWVRATRAAMRPHVSGFAYQNYIDPDLADWKHAYYGANLARLTAVKRAYDPRNLFHFAQSIPLRP
ncbi:MAG TPA: FAD-binding oxidoreductase [Gaiellaceae bacterium]